MLKLPSKRIFGKSAAHNFHRDNGHFFYTEKTGDFTLTLKWHSDEPLAFAQCGVMVRLDNLNWAKGGVLSPDLYKPQFGNGRNQRRTLRLGRVSVI